ncbi:TFIIH basal transcription factor complex, subunit SSL1 [Hortaea werneckii]|nr:TFIIH basal transcription factor complex, subunit SSL1 [Hortaea werneckii]
MADSGDEYDEDDVVAPGRGGKKMASRPKERGQARWEESVNRNWELQEAPDGSIEGVLGGLEEADKRKRLLKDTTPLQRGIIRHTLLVLDLSTAMNEKDLRPTRHLLTINYTIMFVREFFEQNPISQLGILGMREGLAIRVSDMSGNPNDHINALKQLRGTEPKGNPSLQNALDMARAALYHTPSHGTREVVIILGALLTSDPGDIHSTIKACIKDRIRVRIIGLAAQMHICAEICRKTNNNSSDYYNVAVDEVDYRQQLMEITTPPVLRATDEAAQKASQAALLMMGFPSRMKMEEKPTLCACHGELTRGGYLCSRCKAKSEHLPRYIFVFDSPRTCSNLFGKLFSADPQLDYVRHPYLLPGIRGPEKIEANMSKETLEALGRKYGGRFSEEDLKAWCQLTYERANEEVAEKIRQAQSNGKILFAHEHSAVCVQKDVALACLRSDNPSSFKPSMRPTPLSDAVLKSCVPAMLIRHPARIVPSLYRAETATDMLRIGDEAFTLWSTVRFTRILYEYLESLGNRPVVVDAEDLVHDTQALVGKLCHALEIDPKGVQLQWDAARPDEPLPEGVEPGFHDVLRASTGIIHEKDYIPDSKLDLDVETKKWTDEFGSEIAQELRKKVDADMETYVWLRERKL